jgi:hypothetical protein
VLISGAVLSGALPADAATGPITPVLANGTTPDLHDGTLLYEGGVWYMYGTEYGCGFTWNVKNTPWCGFGVSTATAPGGPWSTPTLLFSPHTTAHNSGWHKEYSDTWQYICSSTGAGCFNPRMIRRSDGVYILWFNAPGDGQRFGANGYWAMGCNGPAGPCGYWAGGAHGSTIKPSLRVCYGHGDFSIITSGSEAAMLCADGGDQGRMNEEELAGDWVKGTGTGSRNIAGDTPGEGVGGYYDSALSQWVMTYSLPTCGYCSGTKSVSGPVAVMTGYATAPSMMGPWTPQGVLSPANCTGQPRTVTAGNYEWIDRWTGSKNETTATVGLEPMTASPWTCT